MKIQEKPLRIRKDIVNLLEKILLSSNISKQTIGILLRSFHNMLPLIIGLMTIIGNKTIVKWCGIVLIFLIVLFYIFDGCILSMLENRICEDNYNIVDPVIELYNIENNYINRINISYYILGMFIILYSGIYYLRFHY